MASIDITTVLSVVTSVASSSAALAYWLGRKFTELNVKIRELDARLENLSNAFIQFSEILTLTLETKDIFTATEALHLKNVVRSLLPPPGAGTTYGRSTRSLKTSSTKI